jgi:hypothetical protein
VTVVFGKVTFWVIPNVFPCKLQVSYVGFQDNVSTHWNLTFSAQKLVPVCQTQNVFRIFGCDKTLAILSLIILQFLTQM